MSDQKEPDQHEASEPDQPVRQDGSDAEPSASGASSSPERGGDQAGALPAPRQGANGLAWLALLLALAAAGFSGWQWWQSTSDDGDRESFASRLDEQAAAIDDQSRQTDVLVERLDDLSGRLEAFEERLPEEQLDVGALRRADDDLSNALAELERRVDELSRQLDQSVSALDSRLEEAGVARTDQIDDSLADASFRLQLLEVAGLLRLGQARAELAADYEVALGAYRQAQSRLDSIDDGRVERLRQLVGRELEALRAVETVNWSALGGQLAALEAESARWSMASRHREDDEPASDAADHDAEGDNGWWSGLKQSMGSLVRVSPRESAPLTPAAAESVRERLRVHLAAAQAAAARRNTEGLASHAETAAELLEAHFDTTSNAVSAALDVLSNAASSASPQSLPDLGDALAEAERRLAAS